MGSAVSEAVVRAYYEAFDAGDREAMLALLAEDVAHDINQGGRETGKEAFRRFLAHMDRCYREPLPELVVMATADGGRPAPEFMLHATYLAPDAGLPPAPLQTYMPPAA